MVNATVKIHGTACAHFGIVVKDLGNGWYKVKVETLHGDRFITVSENQIEVIK